MSSYISIKELAEQQQTSVQALYKKLNKIDKEFKDKHIKKIDGKQMLDDELVERLTSNNTSSEPKEKVDYKELYIEKLKSENKTLQQDKENLTKLLAMEKEIVLRLTTKDDDIVEVVENEINQQLKAKDTEISELKNTIKDTQEIKSNNEDLINQVSELMKKLKELEQTKIDAPIEITKKTLIQRIFNL